MWDEGWGKGEFFRGPFEGSFVGEKGLAGFGDSAVFYVNLYRIHRHAAFTMREAKWTRIFVRRGGVAIPL